MKQQAPPCTPDRVTDDYMLLEDLAKKLKRVSEKKLKAMHKREGLPLRSFGTQGPFYCFWSEVELWLKRKT